jgi:lysophospholipase L1-like esterase
MRILAASLPVAFCLAAAVGCAMGGKDGPTGPTGPPPSGSAVVYSVVGASDVIGLGSSKPCLPFEDCNGNGYAWVAARQLRTQGFTVTVGQLGIPGAVISRTFQDLAILYGRTDVPLNLIQSAMPFVKRDATVVTLFTGANDVNVVTGALGRGAGGSDPTGFIDQQVAVFAADFATLLNGVRSGAPAAQIIVMNLPNMGALPFMAGASPGQKQAAQRASVKITNTIINTAANIRVIDLMCDARFYQSSTYSADGFHPNDTGYAYMAGEIVNALTSASFPAPRASCSQMTLVP